MLRVADATQNRYERVRVDDREFGVVGEEEARRCQKAKVSCHAGNACTFFGKFQSAQHENGGTTNVVRRKTSPVDNVVIRRGDLAYITGLSRRC